MADENKLNLVGKVDRAKEWKAKLVIFVTGLFIFEAITGFIVYFGPFNISVQFMVLLHTILGLIFVVPYVWYQLRHYLLYRPQQLNHIKFLGYSTFVALLVCVVSGLVLTYQSVFGTRINYTWDLLHVISSFVAIPILIIHIVILLGRHLKLYESAVAAKVKISQKRFGTGIVAVALVCFILLAVAVYTYVPVTINTDFPEDYSYKYGENPYAPSLSSVSTGRAVNPKAVAESKSCGSSGCHEQILEEWIPSSHRWSSMDAAFQAVQTAMAANNGPESTRYCGGCHDPIALFSGSKNLYSDDLSSYGADEGVSCVICHSITETDVKGNANYVLTPPERYIYEMKDGKTAKFLSDFLIRSYPKYHIKTFARELYKTPEYCGACHKQFIDKQINNVGWVQLQNQYDNWRKSRWNSNEDPNKNITCRECHMRLSDSDDPASGDVSDYNRSADDGKHRNHRFIGANQFMPAVLNLPGADEQIRLVEEWLRGETVIPEIQDKWMDGPAVPIKLVVPEKVSPGEDVKLKVLLTSNKVGHDFPTGPLDIIQVWLDIEVKDEAGNVIYQSGGLDEGHFIGEGSFIFKAEGIDQYGNLIDKHNLWEMVGVRYRRSLFPGYSDAAEFEFICPSLISETEKLSEKKEYGFKVTKAVGDELTVSAKLRYRKADQFLINFLFPNSGLTAAVTDMSFDSATIRLVNGKG